MKLSFAVLVITRTLSGGVASDETASPTLSRAPTKSHEPADSATTSSTVFVAEYKSRDAAVEIGSTPYGKCYNLATNLQFCAATESVCAAGEEYRGPYSAAFSSPECTCERTHTGACVNVAGPGEFTFGHCGVAVDSCYEGEVYLTATTLKESGLPNDCRLCENTWDETAAPTYTPTHHDWSHNSSHLWNTNVVNGRHEVARRVQFDPFPLLHTIRGDTGAVLSVGFNNDGTRIVSNSLDNTVEIWDAQNGGSALQTLSGHTSTVGTVAFSNDGTRIVSGSRDKTVKVWDAHNGGAALLTFIGHTDSVNSVGFNNDGTRIVSGSSDKTVKVWDAQNGGAALKTFSGHTGTIWSVGFNNDGTRIVSGSFDAIIKIWDAQNGGAALHTLSGHARSVYSVSFNNDGTRIVSGSGDKTIKVWDAQNRAPALKTFSGHTDIVWSVGFNNDGTQIVSGSSDKTINIWDAQNDGAVLQILSEHTWNVWSVAFSNDGTQIVSGSGDETIKIWGAISPPDSTEIPSATPTMSPSTELTDLPSEGPSAQPTLLPSDVPSDIPSEVPSAAPSMPPNGSNNDVLTCSCTGDPHYKTWDSTFFDFQGNCDQILIDNDILQLQVRTRPSSSFSIISQVALKLKNPDRTVFQFQRGEDLDMNPLIFFDGFKKIDYEKIYEEVFYAQYNNTYFRSDFATHAFRFKNEGKDEYIKVTETWHGGFGVNVKGGVNMYSGSEGMCGNWNGGMKNREDSETITVTDSTSINAARSWQVRVKESILIEPSTYCEAYTKPCDHESFPDATFNCYDESRRMLQNNQGNSTVTPMSDLKCADLSCAAIPDPTMRAFCQSDVRISGDPRWACQIDYLLSDVVIPDPCLFDVEQDKSKFLRGRKDGSTKIRTCGWLKKRKDKFRSRLCTKQVHYFKNIATGKVLTPPQIACPDTCASCDKCFENPKTKYTHSVKEGDTPTVYKNCNWLAKKSPEKVKRICNRSQSAGGYPTPIKACPVTCGLDTCVL